MHAAMEAPSEAPTEASTVALLQRGGKWIPSRSDEEQKKYDEQAWVAEKLQYEEVRRAKKAMQKKHEEQAEDEKAHAAAVKSYFEEVVEKVSRSSSSRSKH